MSFPNFQSAHHLLLSILPFVLEFNYDDPSKWPSEYPTCSGYHQSPISIFTYKAIPITLPPLLFHLYDEPLRDPLTVLNNGHTIEFEVPETIYGAKPSLTGGSLQNDFIAETVHFHWGSPKRKGTEHSLNGRRYDLEMHIVHRNARYETLTEAREFKDGLSVVAVLFKAVQCQNLHYPGLNTIFETLDDLMVFNSTTITTNHISLGSLLGDIYRRDFITYQGSLTSPPCSESVTWNIFPEILPISMGELSKFWNLLDRRGRPLQNNFRPIQKRGLRKVYRSTWIWNENFIIAPENDFVQYSSQWR